MRRGGVFAVSNDLTRRRLLGGAAGIAGVLALGACGRSGGAAVAPTSEAVRRAEAARQAAGARLVTARLAPRPVTLDLGGPTVDTWAYGDSLPGPLLRGRAGDRLRVDLSNNLPADTTVHWHGVALRNDMDGVPDVTQAKITPGGAFRYEFTVPDPGTYFYHPHVGVQLDRGLYGVLVVDDPDEPGRYDAEWILVLDDWVDGTGRTPDQVLESLARSGTAMGGMDGMGGMGGMGSMTSPLLGGAGDVSYPYYLANGRVPSAPLTFTGRPGQRVRLRIVNAGSDTAFRVAVGGHRLTVTHTDGFAVQPQQTDALLIAMGERFDVELTLGDGVFPLVAAAEGKSGLARALVRTSAGRVPSPSIRPAELGRQVLLANDLRAAAGRAGRTATAEVLQPVDDVPPHARARAHLRHHRRRSPQRHHHRQVHAVTRRRARCEQSRPVGIPLPQRLSRRTRHDGQPFLPPHLTKVVAMSNEVEL